MTLRRRPQRGWSSPGSGRDSRGPASAASLGLDALFHRAGHLPRRSEHAGWGGMPWVPACGRGAGAWARQGPVSEPVSTQRKRK